MNGSEFQEVYRYMAELEARIKVLEDKIESDEQDSEVWTRHLRLSVGDRNEE